MRIIKDPSLVLELQFDEGIGSRAVDQSKYDNHGDIKGATWTKGVIGNALKFDGVDDYVKIEDVPELNGVTEAVSYTHLTLPTKA